MIEDTYGEQSIKFAAGDMVLYPASSLHRVEAITRGTRWASFFWIQSMVKDDGSADDALPARPVDHQNPQGARR